MAGRASADGKASGTQGTPGAEVSPSWRAEPQDYVVLKHRWSAFAGTPMDILLRSFATTRSCSRGLNRHRHSLRRMLPARDLGYHLVILRDACHTHRADAQEFCMTRISRGWRRLMTVAEATELLAMTYLAAVDIGGTFTDAVAVDETAR